jgi:hypothetical protein
MFVKLLALLISHIFFVVLVSFGVAGPSIQTTVERVKKGKRSEVMFPATALERNRSDRVHCV